MLWRTCANVCICGQLVTAIVRPAKACGLDNCHTRDWLWILDSGSAHPYSRVCDSVLSRQYAGKLVAYVDGEKEGGVW